MPWCAALAALGITACATRVNSQLSRYEFTQPHMGLPFRIVLFAADEPAARGAADAAFNRIKQLNDLLSDYDAESELSRLSRTAGQRRAVPVSDDLWNVLHRAQEVSTRSEGAFDVTVGPLVDLWRRARRQKKPPDQALLTEARKSVGYHNILLDSRNRTVELSAPRTRLDLGAIAKGYAIEEALKVLKKNGIARVLVSGGGDLAAGDPPPGKKGWRIEIAPLDVPNAPPARFVLLANRALASSGDVFQHVEIDGKRYSHIVDPRTGIGLTDHSLVTVIARDCTTADALATAVSVLGPRAGLKLIETTKGAAAYIVRKPNEQIETAESSRFGRYYEQN